MHHLVHQLGGGIAARHFDQRRRIQQAVGELLDLVGEGRGEQQVLPLLRQQREDLADVADETHVEHAVGLVQHQNFDLRQVDRPLADVVEQAARRGDQDVNAAAQLVGLRAETNAAEDHGGLERDMLAVGAYALLHLRRELARGRENQRAHRALRAARPGVQKLQQRQRETGGLAGAGLRAGENIAAFENDGDGLQLDGGGLGVALFGHSTE